MKTKVSVIKGRKVERVNMVRCQAEYRKQGCGNVSDFYSEYSGKPLGRVTGYNCWCKSLLANLLGRDEWGKVQVMGRLWGAFRGIQV